MTDALSVLAAPILAGLAVVVGLIYVRRRWGRGRGGVEDDGGWSDGGDGGGD